MYVHFLPSVNNKYGRVDDSEIFKQPLEKHCKILLIRRQRYFIFLILFLQKDILVNTLILNQSLTITKKSRLGLLSSNIRYHQFIFQ